MLQGTNTPTSEDASADTRPPSLDTLTRLTGDGTAFLGNSWHREPHLHHAFEADEALLDLRDFDTLISQYGLRSPMVWLMGGGEPGEPARLRSTLDGTPMVEGLVVPESVGAALLQGRTVSLRGLNHFWPAVGRAGRSLEAELSHPVQSNAYLTPARTHGLAIHHDPHDVFVIQTHGEKVWEVFRPRTSNPIAPWNSGTDEPGDLIGEYRLRAGDCLYIPLGFPHRARTEDQPSLHVTLGVQVRRWLDVVEVLCAHAEAVPTFREPLPVGFDADPQKFRERLLSRLQLLVLWASDERLVEPLVDSLWTSRRPPLDGHIADVASLPGIHQGSHIAWRTDHTARLSTTDEGLTVHLWDGNHTFPSRWAPALNQLRRGGTVRVSDLDGDLGDAESVDLVRRLVTAGVVRLMPDA